MDLDKILQRAAELLEVSSEEIEGGGRYRKIVEARRLISYWAVRELKEEGAEVARRLGVTQPAVSQAVARGHASSRRGSLASGSKLICLWIFPFFY